MQLQEALATLESLGTEQNRKIYRRHGVVNAAYGVSYANLGKLVKSIKTDHALAVGLWKSGNHDARILATMIADLKAFTVQTLDGWSKDLSNYVVTDAFARMVAKTPHAKVKGIEWCESRDEWLGSAGWVLVNALATQDTALPDGFFVKYVKDVESRILRSENRIRYAMLGALIGIGSRGGDLETKVLTAAKRIGKVEIDHGETGCKTPDVPTYLQKIKDHAASRSKGTPRIGNPPNVKSKK